MKLSVIIPVLNEEGTVSKIINKVLAQKEVLEVIVVDDGSTDKTLPKLKDFYNNLSKSRKDLLRIFTHTKNLGKGAAIRTGITKIKGDFIIIQDADLEYNPQEYKKLLEKVSEKTVVYGSRILADNPRAYIRTYLGNMLISNLYNLLFGTKLTDLYTCYKLLPARIAKNLNLSSNGFEIEAEISAKLARQRVQIIEVPISYKPRSYEKGKKIKARDALFGVFVLLKIKLKN